MAGIAWRSTNAVICSAESCHGRVSADEERPDALSHHGGEGAIQFAVGPGFHNLKLHPERWRRTLDLPDLQIDARTVRVYQDGDHNRFGHGFVQELESLGIGLNAHAADTGYIAAWAIHAGDEAVRNRVGAGLEHDRDRRGCRLCRETWRRGGAGGNHSHAKADKIGRQRRQLLIVTIRIAIFGCHIAALDVSDFREATLERLRCVNGGGRRRS
jgi:hypothetical protein